jgi:hypothetical protein
MPVLPIQSVLLVNHLISMIMVSVQRAQLIIAINVPQDPHAVPAAQVILLMVI